MLHNIKRPDTVNKIQAVAILIVLGVSGARAQTPAQRGISGVSTFKVQLVQFSESSPFPAGFPRSSIPGFWQPGCSLTFLIEGQNLAHIKRDSLVLDVLATRDGRDIRKRNGANNYKMGHFPEVSGLGKYGLFTVESIDGPVGQMQGGKIEGSISITKADGSEVFSSAPFDLKKNSQFKLGEFQCTVSLQAQVADPIGIATLIPIGSAPKPTPESTNSITEASPQSQEFVVDIKGPISKIASLKAAIDGKTLSYSSNSWSDDSGTYRFLCSGGQQGAVKIIAWKNPQEAQLPFRFDGKEAPVIAP